MNDAMFEELLALRQKRPLTPEEQACLAGWLATRPANRVRWTEEAALSDALHRLPETPVSSNFMARIWQNIEADELRSERAAKRDRGFCWPGVRWPGLGTVFSVFVVLLLFMVGSQSKRTRRQAQMAERIHTVATLTRLPSVELLKDFEAISRLSQSGADVELLAAFERER